jgi:hypothetical protein
MVASESVRVFRVDDHILRIDMGDRSAPADVYRYGRWLRVVITSEQVLGLTAARELSADEIAVLNLPV